MKKLILAVSLMMLPVLTQAGAPMKDLDLGATQCNWGVLTMNALIQLNFDNGGHSADPHGDGIGVNDPEHHDSRAGLPNALGDESDLEALCEFVGCALFPDDPICL